MVIRCYHWSYWPKPSLFFDNAEDNALSNAIIESYFKGKVFQYEKQDHQANRTVEKHNFVNIKWLASGINQRWFNCNTDLYVDVNSNSYCYWNITADRVDNSQDHNSDNIRPCCYHCSCTLGNRNLNHFLFTDMASIQGISWQIDIKMERFTRLPMLLTQSAT